MKERISKTGTKLTRRIGSSKYYVYIDFLKVALYNQINRLAKLTDKVVKFKEW